MLRIMSEFVDEMLVSVESQGFIISGPDVSRSRLEGEILWGFSEAEVVGVEVPCMMPTIQNN